MSLTSSTVAELGRLTVLLMAPETKGCTAAIMRTWPSGAIVRPPGTPKAQSNTGRWSASKPGAPSMAPVTSTWAMIAARCSLVVAEGGQRPLDVGVDELHVAAADQRLVADEADRRLDAGRLGVHHEADRPGRRDHADLGVAVARRADAARGLAERDGVVQGRGRGRAHLGVAGAGGLDRQLQGGVAVHPHDPVLCLAVGVVAVVGAHAGGDARRLRVGLALQEGGDGAAQARPSSESYARPWHISSEPRLV